MQLTLPLASSQSQRGYLAMCVTLMIWTGFALSIRAIGHSHLTTLDVALIRFTLPCFLLLPMWRRSWQSVRQANWKVLWLIPFGAGVPFFWMASLGAAATSAAHVGALISGTVPLFVSLLAWLSWRQALSRTRIYGLGLIIFGIITLISATETQHSILSGIAMLLGASVLWSLYTLGIRQSGLDAISCNLVLCAPSCLITLGLLLSGTGESHLLTASWHDLLPFVLLQGVGVGIVSGLCYGYSIREIGAERSALIGSLTPALTALLAIPLMGEALSSTLLIGVLLITTGVATASLQRQ